MFLSIVDVYLIFKYSQWKLEPVGIKINIDLEATGMEKKIYMAHFYPLWIEHNWVTHGSLLPQKEAKPTE